MALDTQIGHRDDGCLRTAIREVAVNNGELLDSPVVGWGERARL